jgi:hypothetical protein
MTPSGGHLKLTAHRNANTARPKIELNQGTNTGSMLLMLCSTERAQMEAEAR